MFSSGLFGEKAAGTSVQAQQTEEKLRSMLLDENVQVISSFALNQIATLTYHESSIADGDDLCELVFETLLSVLSKPAQYPPLALVKALVVTQHVLIFGAEAVIKESVVLGRPVEALQEYNTVLLAQQQPQTASGMLMRIKGGGVDKGGPVRERAQLVHGLLADTNNKLRFERNAQADPNSLVPVGDDRLAFASDEVRLHALKKRMEHQSLMETRSNLAKADNGFGSGYNSKDGKSVVGAAHGLDEMMKLAKAKERREKMKFSDAGPSSSQQQQQQQQHEPFTSYVAPTLGHPLQHPAAGAGTAATTGDLLFSMEDTTTDDNTQFGSAAAAAEVDLLDLGAGGGKTSTNGTSYANDFLGVTAPSSENSLLDIVPPSSSTSSTAAAPDVWATGDLLGSMSISGGGAAGTSAAGSQQQLHNSNNDILGNNSSRSLQQDEQRRSVSPPPQPPPIMGGSAATRSMSGGNDPFAALDALSSPGTGPTKGSDSTGTGSNTLGFAGSTSSNGGSSGGMLASMNNSNSNSSNAFTGLYNIQVAAPATPAIFAVVQEQVPAYTTSLKISDSSWGGGGGGSADAEDDENGFVMGGCAGAGLEPIGAAPAAPPPPPPPPPTFY